MNKSSKRTQTPVTKPSRRKKVSLNQFMWSQVAYIPNDYKFFYVAPGDSFALFTWFEAGNMRGSGGIGNIRLNDPFRFGSDEKKLRGEVITAGSYLELIIEGLIYIDIGLYDPVKPITQKQIDSIVSNKVEKRTDWLTMQGVISKSTRELAKAFFAFRNKVAHSYTF